jgi:hypothetical protein
MAIVSTSALDTMDVLVDGLDADYNVLQEIVTLTGTVADRHFDRHCSHQYHKRIL